MGRRTNLIITYIIPILGVAVSAVFIDDPGALISLIGSIILIQIAFIYHQISYDLIDALEFIRNRATTEPIREKDFYDRFRVDIRNADNYVYISYFDNKNPLEDADDEVVKYYEDIKEIIKSSSNVDFRRIVRGIPELNGWISEMLDEHQGDANFSLACILDEEPEASTKPHISVQLVDNDVTYFVAVGEQRETGEVPRDLRIQSEEVSNQWKRYYNRIWESSTVLLDQGRRNDVGISEYQDHIEQIDSDD